MRLVPQIQIFALMALTLVGCNRQTTLDVGEFHPYVQRFEQEASRNGAPLQVSDLIIRYGAMQNALERAACELTDGETPLIIVRQDTWDRMSDAEREELMFHEMGHCILKRKHNSNLTDDGYPESIMNPYMIRGTLYETFRNAYLAELFAK